MKANKANNENNLTLKQLIKELRQQILLRLDKGKLLTLAETISVNSLLNTLVRIYPESRGLLPMNRVRITLVSSDRGGQEREIKELADKLYAAVHPIVFRQDGSQISQSFSRLFCLIFTFEHFTDNEVYDVLSVEVRRKYK